MIEFFEVQNCERRLRGLIHKGYKKVPIIIVHGYFSSNKIGPHRLYFQIANKLNELGYTVLRIDLSGMGESDGDLEGLEFDIHVSDLNKIINKLLKETKSEKIHLIGHCIGCCNVLSNAELCKELVNSITLISPFIPSDNNFHNIFGVNLYSELVAKGYVYRKGLFCSKSFINASDIIINNRYIELCKGINTFVYISGNDELCDSRFSSDWAKRNIINYKVIDDADHNFLEIDTRKKLLAELNERFFMLNEEF